MAEPKGLKSLLTSVNNRDDKASGLAVEGENYIKKRKNETQEEYEKRKKAFARKIAKLKKEAQEAMKDMR